MAIVHIHNAGFSELEAEVWFAWQEAGVKACREAGKPLDFLEDGLPVLCDILQAEFDLPDDERDRIATKLLTTMENALDLMEAEPMGGVH